MAGGAGQAGSLSTAPLAPGLKKKKRLRVHTVVVGWSGVEWSGARCGGVFEAVWYVGGAVCGVDWCVVCACECLSGEKTGKEEGIREEGVRERTRRGKIKIMKMFGFVFVCKSECV